MLLFHADALMSASRCSAPRAIAAYALRLMSPPLLRHAAAASFHAIREFDATAAAAAHFFDVTTLITDALYAWHCSCREYATLAA